MPLPNMLSFELRSGPPPDDRQSPDRGQLLGIAALPLHGAVSGGVHRHVTITTQIISTGTAGHFRLKQDGSCIDQGTIGRFGDGADLVLGRLALLAGEMLTLQPRFTARAVAAR